MVEKLNTGEAAKDVYTQNTGNPLNNIPELETIIKMTPRLQALIEVFVKLNANGAFGNYLKANDPDFKRVKE